MWGSHPPWRSSHTMGGTNGLIRTGPPLKVYRSKTCRACGKPKYLEDFPALPMHHGRRRNICYECFSKEASPTEDSGKSPSPEELSRQEYSIWEEKIPKINLTWDRLWSRGYLPRAAPRNAREILKENPIVGPTCPPEEGLLCGACNRWRPPWAFSNYQRTKSGRRSIRRCIICERIHYLTVVAARGVLQSSEDSIPLRDASFRDGLPAVPPSDGLCCSICHRYRPRWAFYRVGSRRGKPICHLCHAEGH